MPYIVTAKRPVELRDGTLPSDKMHQLKTGVPVVFQHCPNGYTPPGDSQVEVQIALDRCEDLDPELVAKVKALPDEPTPQTHKRHYSKKHKG